jgi:hypothetical protein
MKTIRIKQVLSQLKCKLQSTERDFLESIAAVTGFIKRKSSKLYGWDFFQLMTAEHFNDAAISLQGLCDVLRTINQEADLSAQALHQRMNSKHAVAFMERVFTVVYEKHLAPMLNNISQSLFESFNRVFLQDSTQIELHEHLAEDFKGSGGGASKSAMKIDLVYELKQSIMEKLTISGGTIPDQSRAAMAIDIVKKGDLIIRDLGYFALDVFGEIARKGAYYLSRYKHQTTIYLSSDAKAKPVNPLELILKNIKDNIADVDIFFRKAETSMPNGCL